jgi:integrase
MLTGQRASEISDLRWSELTTITVPAKRVSDTVVFPQFTIRAIELPAARVKNKRPHLIPLSPQASAIIDAQQRRADDDGQLRDYVFGVGTRGFQGWTDSNASLNNRIAKELGSPLEHWVIHDLRRTFSTLLNDRLGVLPHVVEACINHVGVAKSGVAGVYNRALYLRERVEALTAWADHLASIADGQESNVTPLRRA